MTFIVSNLNYSWLTLTEKLSFLKKSNPHIKHYEKLPFITKSGTSRCFERCLKCLSLFSCVAHTLYTSTGSQTPWSQPLFWPSKPIQSHVLAGIDRGFRHCPSIRVYFFCADQSLLSPFSTCRRTFTLWLSGSPQSFLTVRGQGWPHYSRCVPDMTETLMLVRDCRSRQWDHLREQRGVRGHHGEF